MIPTSLYIHLPWCIKKCPYCDFNAHPLKEDTDFEQYIQVLIQDLYSHQDLLSTRKLESIFIGGGTPSLFQKKTLLPLFKAIESFQPLDMEITIEANPGTQDFARYQEYRDLGINRISIGGQSFNPTMLKNLGRVHSNDHLHQAILQAKSAGFERINLDIMHALPHQTTQQALEDLETFLSYDLEHLSWYQLNIEANTLFYVKKPDLPPSHIIDEIDEKGSKLLTQHGYSQYEISAWTNNQPSQHNLNYWHFGDYIGIGAGAHSKITQKDPFQIQRLIKHKHPKAYVKQTLQSEEIIDQDSLILEYLIGYFRTKSPLYFKDFRERTQLDHQSLIQKLQKARGLDLVAFHEDRIELTPKGFNHHNEICLSLI